VLDASGKEQTGSEIFVDPTSKVEHTAGSVEWEIIYDAHGIGLNDGAGSHLPMEALES